jgi:transcriptional regulator with XRE-family HTH domain
MKPSSMKPPKETGQRIFQIYKALGFKSYSDFAKRIGISKAAVGQWFNGKVEPDPRYLIKLMKVFPEVNKNFLLFGKPPVLELAATQQYKERNEEIESLKKENERLREMIADLTNTINVLHKFYKVS